MTSVLLVEDNERMRGLMAVTLRRSGYTVLEANHGEEALDVMEDRPVSLIIADLLMPVMDGFTLIETLRSVKIVTPILVITAKESIDDKQKGFDLGADDYLVKPFDMNEMLMRVGALLRRAKIADSHILTIGDTTLNQDSLTTLCGKNVIVLPHKEFFLLQRLLSYPGKIFTRQSLMDEVWGYDNNSDPRTVDVHIRRLREKYEDNPDFAIETIRGLGYRAVVR